MDNELAGRLVTVIGEEQKFQALVDYLQSEEDLIHKENLNANEVQLRQNQGKLQFIEKLKHLRLKAREIVRDSRQG